MSTIDRAEVLEAQADAAWEAGDIVAYETAMDQLQCAEILKGE